MEGVSRQNRVYLLMRLTEVINGIESLLARKQHAM
jgi:hypothetical protein